MRDALQKPQSWLKLLSEDSAFTLGEMDEVRRYEHISPPAAGFITAHVLDQIRAREPKARIWILTSNLREQERLAADLKCWNAQVDFLPEREADIEGRGFSDPESAADRLFFLEKMAKGNGSPALLLTKGSLNEEVPRPDDLMGNSLELKVGTTLDPADLAASLDEAGYERVPQIFSRGQFAVRGGIIDAFSYAAPFPIRVEFFDDEIDSLREFDLDSQGARRKMDAASLSLGEPEGKRKLSEWVDWKKDYVIAVAEGGVDAKIIITEGGSPDEDGIEDYAAACYGSPLGSFEAGDFVLESTRRQQLFRQLDEWRMQSWRVGIFFANKGEESRFKELIGDERFSSGDLVPLRGQLAKGFTVPGVKMAILSSSEIFGRYQSQSPNLRRSREQEARKSRGQASLREFQEGDQVVHAEYGIARFIGIEKGDDDNEELHLEFRDGATLAVPLDQAHLVSKYIGLGGREPDLSKLGDGKWARTKAIAEGAIVDYAAKLLQIQAQRESQKGFAFPPDTEWMWEFENSFRYKETPDQLSAIRDLKRDMESDLPMDRLICGDVGFGKTEVALRAAFKAVTSGKQVAMLVPTTVLAEQHWRTFRERMSDYPFKIELLSRFRKPSEIRESIKAIANGSADLAIGTHRLISKDINFKDLGLVIIDEEQRFGVAHKEKFKQLFAGVDVLTLSATPIPRTLYLSLMGARDMSTIETAPPNRVPVATTVCAYDERIIRDSIKREIERGGQVFFLHNRVKTIERVKQSIEQLVPGVKVVIGHGQMDKSDLEVVMKTFVEGKADVLLATTIIESGIDIPNANTILIDRADRFGLADLYQLRGRVGRGGHQAYAILLLPRQLIPVGDARKRVNAIKQYSALGSGFRIAMRDLEIRGAGNLLGTQQSGHIAAVGFDLYCQLLKQSIDRIQGKLPTERVEVALRADFLCFNEAAYLRDGEEKGLMPAFVPSSYLSEPRLRITAYKALAELSTLKDLEALEKNWRDRFGRFPEPVENLLLCTRLKIRASQSRVSSIEIKAQRLMLIRNGDYLQLEGGRFPRLSEISPNKKLLETVKLINSLA